MDVKIDAKLLKQMRKKARLSQSDVANEMKIQSTVLSMYENGKRKIPNDLALKLTDFYKIMIELNTSLDSFSGQYLKELRLKCRLSQKEVAEKFEINQTTLSRYEQERTKIPSSLAEKLKDFYHRYFNHFDVNENLETKFDWIRVTFPKHWDWEEISTKVLSMPTDVFWYEETRRYGYVGCYVYGAIRVYYAKKKDPRGIMIEMSGDGCRNYDAVLDSLGETWKHFFIRCMSLEDFRFKRIDCALDDKVELVSIPVLIKKYEKGQYQTNFKKIKVISQGKGMGGNGAEHDGSTLHFGSRTGTINIALYQKDYEQANKLGIPREEVKIKNRYEIRLMNEKAETFIQQYLDSWDMAPLIKSIISDYITFYEYDKHNQCLGIDKNWQNLMRSIEKVNFISDPKEVSLEKTLTWLQAQVSKSLKKAVLYGDGIGENILGKIIEDAELNEKDEMQVVQAITLASEMIK